jgi:hypothetical protein
MTREPQMAEREGFEPSRGSTPLLAFQASAFNRSTTSPFPRSAAPLGGSNRFDSLIAALLSFLLLAATAPNQQRHVVPGHYNVPQPWLWKPVVGTSTNAIANPDFESGQVNNGWFQCGDVAAYVTKEHPYGGTYDAYAGTATGSGEPRGNSGICQRVTIPRAGTLSARLYQLSNEGNAVLAYQEADLLDDQGDVVLNLYRAVNNKAAWIAGQWNLSAYAGRSFWLYFGVHGDGYPKISTQQFVDDVFLAGVSPPGPK